MLSTYTTFCVISISNIFFVFTENILKYYRIFDMYIPPKMIKNNKFLISDAIDKIRTTLEVDKYSKEEKQIGKS